MNPWIPSHIQVTIIQARDLALKSKSIHSEVFVVVQVEKEKQVTHSLPRHTCPQWNQTFDIPLMSLDSSINITVRQKNKFSDEYIGYLHIPFTNLSISKRQRQNWYKLVSKPGKASSKIRGDLLVSTSFLSKWDRTAEQYSNPVDIELEGRMLRRSKSEYKSSTTKESPKQEKNKSKGLFSRSLRKKNSQVFEDSDDFVLTVRGSGDPPTPPQSERKQLNFSSPATDSESYEDTIRSPEVHQGENPNHMLFTEATHLERNGIIDLWRADPIMRREQIKQQFREGVTNTESPKCRPVSMHSPSLSRNRQQSSFDSSYEEESPKRTDTTVPAHTVTYRARSTPRRPRNNSISTTPITTKDKSLISQASNTSIDSNTSEYYSGSSTATTPSNSNTLTSNDGVATPTNASPTTPKRTDIIQTGTSSKRRLDHLGHTDSPSRSPVSTRREKVRRGATMDSSSTLPRLRPQTRPHVDRSSTLQRELSRDRDGIRSHVRQRHLSSDFKRHSADVAQILKLNNSSRGKDGLENIINSGQVQRFLRKRTDRGNHDDSIADKDQPSKDTPTSLVSGGEQTRRVFDVPAPPFIEPAPLRNSTDTPTDGKDTPTDGDDTPTDGQTVVQDGIDKDNCEHSNSMSQDSSDLLPPIGHMDDHVTHDDVIICHEETSTSPHAKVAIAIDSPLTSGSTTPSRMSPPLSSTDVTRDTTPSPDQDEIDGIEEITKERESTEKKRVKHTVELKKSDGRNNFQPFKPLPPSIATASSGSGSYQRKYSSTTDITSLLAQCKDIISPPPSSTNLEVKSSTNIRPSSQCSYPYSTTSSGRTSPAIIEEEEERKENSAPMSTPLSSNRQLMTSPSVPPLSAKSTNVTQRKQGGGLKRTLSMYQENKRQAQISREKKSIKKQKTLSKSFSGETTHSGHTGSNSPERKTSDNNSPLSQQQNSVVPHQNSLEENEVSLTAGTMGQPSSLGASFTASKSSHHQKPSSKQLGSNSPSLSSHETHHSIHSQTNSAASSIPGTPPVYASSIPGTPPVYASSIPGTPPVYASSIPGTPPVYASSIPGTPPVYASSIPGTPPVYASSIPGTPPLYASSIPRTPPVYDHFTLPYPGVSQLAISGDSESTTSEVITSGRTSICSDTETTTCSEVEEVTEDYLQEWSKDALISELIRTKSKLKTRTYELQDTRRYLESLLIKVMDQNPDLLLSGSP